MKIPRWLPLIAVALAFLIALGYVVANPLPANGYGRPIYDVRTTLAIAAGSSRTILMAEGSVVPSRSLILVVAGVMNRQPGSDLSETAYFRLTHAGATIAQGDVSPLSESFETRVESGGATTRRCSSAMTTRSILRSTTAPSLRVRPRPSSTSPRTSRSWSPFLRWRSYGPPSTTRAAAVPVSRSDRGLAGGKR